MYHVDSISVVNSVIHHSMWRVLEYFDFPAPLIQARCMLNPRTHPWCIQLKESDMDVYSRPPSFGFYQSHCCIILILLPSLRGSLHTFVDALMM